MFTYSNYKEMIELLKRKNFEFLFFDERSEDKELFLRHDVDYSLDLALEFARFEHSIGVRSTYFVLTRTSNYLLSEKKLKTFYQLGHDLGLHYEIETAIIDQNAIEKELESLSRLLDREIKTFSFHCPTKCGEEGVQGLYEDYPGLVSTYSPAFFKQGIYISESNRHWRVGNPIEFINNFEGKRLQILTHPVWWSEKPRSKEACLESLHSLQNSTL